MSGWHGNRSGRTCGTHSWSQSVVSRKWGADHSQRGTQRFDHLARAVGHISSTNYQAFARVAGEGKVIYALGAAGGMPSTIVRYDSRIPPVYDPASGNLILDP